MSLLGKIVGGVRKLSNFLGLGIPSLVESWLKPDVPDREGVQVSRDGSNLDIPVVYGEQRVGAIKVHKIVSDNPGGLNNEYLHLICVFCEGEVEAIDELFFNGVSENDSRWRSGGRTYFTKSTNLGGPDQVADASAVAAISNWTTEHRLRGLAYVYLRIEMDESREIWRGEPDVSARIRGRKVYDPRLDSTLDGGSGAHRVGDPSTWTYSNNPLLCLRDYLTNDIYGKGLDDNRIDIPSIVSGANFCDESTTAIRNLNQCNYETELRRVVCFPSTETITIRRFTCNLVLDTERSLLDNTSEILGVFRGIMPPEYIIAPVIETTGTPIFDFNEDNIVGSITVDSGKINRRYNRVSVRFPNILSNFEYDEEFFPKLDDPLYQTFLAEDDGIELEGEFTFNGINNKAEALQMAEIICRRNRFLLTCHIQVQPIGIIYTVGDIVSVTDSTHGWDSKPFRISDKDISEEGSVGFTLTEHEDNIYPWSGRSYEDVQGGTFLGNPEDIDAPTNVSFTPDLTLASTGDITWQSTQDGFIRGFNVTVDRTTEVDGTVLSPPVRIFNQDVDGNRYNLPLVGAGTYNISVVARSSIGTFSPAATLSLPLTLPIAPISLNLVARNWEITSAPTITNGGLGTVFQFDIVAGDGVGHIPVPENGEGSDSHTFTGLIPNTQYTVFARSVNAFGLSPYVSQTVTTTFTDVQVEPYLGPINDRIQDAEDDIAALGDIESPFGNLEIINTTEIFTNVGENSENSEAVRTETRERRSETSNLTARINTTDGELSAAVTRVDSVEVQSNGNAQAISGVQTQVNDPSTGLIATSSRVNTVEATANGNVTAIGVIQSQVNNPTTGLSATATIAAEARGTANTAIARVFLTTDVNGRVGGLVIGNDGNTVSVDFQGDAVRFFNTDGVAVIRFDTANNRYVFDGEVIARAGTFTGALNSATGTFAGSLSAATGTFTGSLQGASGSFTNISGQRISLNDGAAGAPTVEVSTSATKSSISSINTGGSTAISASGNATIAGNPTILGNGGIRCIQAQTTQSGAQFDFYANGTGTYGPFTGSHDGIIEDGEYTEGDIVEDLELIHIADIGNAICRLGICQKEKSKAARGVLAFTCEVEKDSLPNALKDYPDIDNLSKGNKIVIFNALGEGAINVCGINGDIEIGDLICSSALKGKGMRQDDDILRNITVAESRQNVTFDFPDQVKQIACIYKCG